MFNSEAMKKVGFKVIDPFTKEHVQEPKKKSSWISVLVKFMNLFITQSLCQRVKVNEENLQDTYVHRSTLLSWAIHQQTIFMAFVGEFSSESTKSFSGTLKDSTRRALNNRLPWICWVMKGVI